MRIADARAATRRGCSITRFGCSRGNRLAARIAGGTRVVLPAPGSATITIARCSRRRSTIAGRWESIGRSIIVFPPLPPGEGRGEGASDRNRVCKKTPPPLPLPPPMSTWDPEGEEPRPAALPIPQPIQEHCDDDDPAGDDLLPVV